MASIIRIDALSCLFLCGVLFAVINADCNKGPCVDVGGQTVCYDPSCTNPGTNTIGCSAGGEDPNCRYCGFGIFPACPGDSAQTTAGGPITLGPPTSPPPLGECRSTGGRVCFRVVNNCAYRIWPGMQGRPSVPEHGGWTMAPGEIRNIYVPDRWEAGRIWARTGCDANYNCDTGFCGNHEQCDGLGGRPPATLAEFTLYGWGNQDYYDISLVDGYNLPVRVRPIDGTFTTNGGAYDCKETGRCVHDLNRICPTELQLMGADGTTVVGCDSACLKFNTDQYCCRGAYGTPQTCRSSDWPVNYPAIFKAACPTDYSYAYDDQTSTYFCRGNSGSSLSSAYEITFC